MQWTGASGDTCVTRPFKDWKQEEEEKVDELALEAGTCN